MRASSLARSPESARTSTSHSYRHSRPMQAEGLPTVVAERYPSSATTIGRLRAMGGATLRPSHLRSLLGDVDVVHYPLTVPVPRPAEEHVITLLDVQHLDLPELFPRGERLFRKLAYDRASRKATEVIVISEFVRERVIERLDLDPGHVHAVWLGVDHERFTPTPHVEREPFLLYPARPWPHKNHARLFEAFALIRRTRPELRLVLTGVGHDAAIASRGRRGAIRVRSGAHRALSLRGVPRLPEPLRGIRASADRGDGVRLPRRCGSRPARSPRSAADAAVLFDPLDPEAIAAGVEEALTRSAELSSRGLRRAATFTWDETARAHDRIYSTFS